MPDNVDTILRRRISFSKIKEEYLIKEGIPFNIDLYEGRKVIVLHLHSDDDLWDLAFEFYKFTLKN